MSSRIFPPHSPPGSTSPSSPGAALPARRFGAAACSRRDRHAEPPGPVLSRRRALHVAHRDAYVRATRRLQRAAFRAFRSTGMHGARITRARCSTTPSRSSVPTVMFASDWPMMLRFATYEAWMGDVDTFMTQQGLSPRQQIRSVLQIRQPLHDVRIFRSAAQVRLIIGERARAVGEVQVAENREVAARVMERRRQRRAFS